VTVAAGSHVDASCPACGGRLHLTPPKQADRRDVRAWAKALREREGRLRGVSDGLTYTTRREAQSAAAWYRRKLAERGLETESATRPRYSYVTLSWRWAFVLWKEGNRPVRALEAVARAHEQSKAERATESIERGWL
jgi:hypothetical protein